MHVRILSAKCQSFFMHECVMQITVQSGIWWGPFTYTYKLDTVIMSPIKCVMNLPIHSQASTVAQFRNTTSYNGCNYFSMLKLKLMHVSKRGPWNILYRILIQAVPFILHCVLGSVMHKVISAMTPWAILTDHLWAPNLKLTFLGYILTL